MSKIAKKETIIFLNLLSALTTYSNLSIAAETDISSIIYIECETVNGDIHKGSGVIVDGEGRILTAKHVAPVGSICHALRGTGATIPNRKLIPGRISAQYDARILKFVPNPGETFRPVTYAKISVDMHGQNIRVYGFPSNGTGQISVRKGNIGTTISDENGMIQTDALTAIGMSGGPVFLDDGVMVGIISGANFDGTGTPTHFAMLAAQEVANELGLLEFWNDPSKKWQDFEQKFQLTDSGSGVTLWADQRQVDIDEIECKAFMAPQFTCYPKGTTDNGPRLFDAVTYDAKCDGGSSYSTSADLEARFSLISISSSSYDFSDIAVFFNKLSENYQCSFDFDHYYMMKISFYDIDQRRKRDVFFSAQYGYSNSPYRENYTHINPTDPRFASSKIVHAYQIKKDQFLDVENLYDFSEFAQVPARHLPSSTVNVGGGRRLQKIPGIYDLISKQFPPVAKKQMPLPDNPIKK